MNGKPGMTERDRIVSFVDSYLGSGRIKDQSQNGLQCEGAPEISKIAFGVSASLECMKRAADCGADMLIVHHGLLWGRCEAFKGPLKAKLELLFKHNMSLAAWHLLDKARIDAAPESVATARVEWLAKGLKQADLMLATEQAYERAVDTGDKTEFLAAYRTLKDFRQANADYDKSNFLGLGCSETTWEKANR